MIRSQYRALQHKTLITLKEKKKKNTTVQPILKGKKPVFKYLVLNELCLFSSEKFSIAYLDIKKQPYDFVKTHFWNISYNLLQLNSINSLQLLFFSFLRPIFLPKRRERKLRQSCEVGQDFLLVTATQHEVPRARGLTVTAPSFLHHRFSVRQRI